MFKLPLRCSENLDAAHVVHTFPRRVARTFVVGSAGRSVVVIKLRREQLFEDLPQQECNPP